MRLLFDHNLSPRLPRRLDTLFPGSAHVAEADLERVSDLEVWTYARVNGFAIVTKDSDFGDLSVVQGFPPKVIWLRLGNCTTREVEAALRAARGAITAFLNDPTVGTMEIW